jgi:hypothetical protein
MIVNKCKKRTCHGYVKSNFVLLCVLLITDNLNRYITMAFDLDMIKGAYIRMQERVKAARKIEGRPLTLAVKNLYSQWWEGTPTQASKRGESGLDLVPIYIRSRR